ncbi:MAG: hypothetical protein WCD79_03260, partial [Chthoniobacteraceae bacterium]
QVQQTLGISANDFAKIQGQISLQDSTSRIISTGIVGNYRREIMVVTRRAIVPQAYLLWQEQ